jgi:light-regulated signal transduction histidine kinase (bacteriophytochrome)
MGKLIDDLLAFSRLGKKQIDVSEINMNALVESIREELVFEGREERTEFNLYPLLPSKGDHTLIRQVWVNLISNAIKYSRHKPQIYIEIGSYEKDSLVVYYVKDNGAGFDMQYYDKLFGVFQRLHSQQEFEGTGIGLAIVQRIVQRHNGTVWAESKLGEGTCFYFSLPDINS